MPSDTLVAPFPAHPLSYTDDEWTCPRTGLTVAKRLDANLDQRLKIIDICDRDKTARDHMVASCASSFLVWLNVFGWTYRQHVVLPNGERKPVAQAEMPFISWPVQDDAAGQIIDSIDNGRDILIDKSRDMGASWLCLSIITWMSLFRWNFTAKVLSRKEDEVDQGGSVLGVEGHPDTLLWKVRYLIARLPTWMQPEAEAARMRVMFPATDGSINGESTNKDAGRGGRRKVILLDECSVYDDLEAIDRATHSAASCRIFNATPVGPGPYSDIRFSGRVKVVTLGWWDHPEKAAGGRYPKMEDGRVVWSGPFREAELAKGTSQKTIAQNLDIDHERSGSTFFDIPILHRQREAYARQQPMSVGMLVPSVRDSDLDEAIRTHGTKDEAPKWAFRPVAGGPLRIWCDLVRDRYGLLVPSWRSRYVMGINIAQGVGASNSSIAVFARQTGEQVAEWTSSTVGPEALARVAAMLGLWFSGGGARCAFMAWEQNGWGQTFGPAVQKLEYPWVYTRVKYIKARPEMTDELGWWNDDRSNLTLLGKVRDALSSDEFRVKSPEALREAERYVFNDTGKVEMAGLEQEGAKARAAHGDRWRAVTIAYEAFQYAHLVPAPEAMPLPGSVEWQLLRDEQERADEEAESFRY